VLVAALFADRVAPYSPYDLDVASMLQGPSHAHWLGTDEVGRDVLSRAIFAARISIKVAVVAVGVGLVGVAAVAAALRMLTDLALRVQVDDIAAQAVEAFTFDVRRAGFDPRGIGVEAVADATPTRLELHADLDGDGVVDAASEEVTAWACDLAGGRLSRILGSQSLPLANDVIACGFGYVDASGAVLATPPSGLDAATRARVRRLTLALGVRPPALGSATAVRGGAALWTSP
jgi:hypothetical protein